MADPEMRAAMKLFSALGEVAYHSDSALFQMITCCMVKLTLRHGTTEFSTIAYASLGIVLGPVFHRFRDGEDFARLAVAVSAWIYGPEGGRPLSDANGCSVDASN